jgi:hypothetical protein
MIMNQVKVMREVGGGLSDRITTTTSRTSAASPTCFTNVKERYVNFVGFRASIAPGSTRNFPSQVPYQPLLGIMEEVGELAHAQL